MRICIPIEFRPEGGGHYFLVGFARYLEATGHQLREHVTASYDVLFTSHWMLAPHQILRAMRANPELRLVQRVDGAAADYGRRGPADAIQRQVNALADLTIFQSRYCRYSTREKFSVIAQDGPVIHNPVDLDLFNPAGARAALPFERPIVCITWSVNPAKGAARVYAVARDNPDLRFVLVGRFPDAPALPNLHLTGPLDREPLAQVLRAAGAYLTFSEHEACPNTVLEAMASGLPVLYLDSGATAELVADGGLAMDERTFRACADEVTHRRNEVGGRARARAEQAFAPARQFGAYVTEIAAALARPPRIPVRARWWRARDPRAVARDWTHRAARLARRLRR